MELKSGRLHHKIRCPKCLLLHGTELHSDNELCLRRHVLEDVSFQPPEHVRSKEVMELLDLVLFRDICKLLKEAFQVAEEIRGHMNVQEFK